MMLGIGIYWDGSDVARRLRPHKPPGREFEMAEVLYNFAPRQNKNRSRNNKEAKVRGSRMSECGGEDDTGK